MPERIRVDGVKNLRNGLSGTSYYDFGENGPNVTSHWGAINEPGLLFRHGFNVRFETGRQMNYMLSVTDSGIFTSPPLTEYSIGTGSNPVSAKIIKPSEDIENNLGPQVRELEQAIMIAFSGQGKDWEADGNTIFNWQTTNPLCPLKAYAALQTCIFENNALNSREWKKNKADTPGIFDSRKPKSKTKTAS